MSDLIVIRAASVARLAPFVSTEATRYYLNGYGIISSAAGGAEIVATDGHRLGMIHDPDAIVPATGSPVILGWSKDLLRAVKAAKETDLKLPGRPATCAWVVIDTARGPKSIAVGSSPDRYGSVRVVMAATADAATDVPASSPDVLSTINGVLIDGSFPDYRRVIPSAEQVAGNVCVDAFNPQYLGDFGTVRTADRRHDRPLDNYDNGAVRIFAGLAGGPAIARVSGAPDFLGVIMPCRSYIDDPIPSWFAAVPAEPMKVAA